MQEQDPAGRSPARLPAKASLSSWLTMFVCSTHRPTCTTLSFSHVSLLYSCVRAKCPSALSSYHSKRIPNNPAKNIATEDHWAPLSRARRVSHFAEMLTFFENVPLYFFVPKNCHHITDISATPYLPGTVRRDWLLSLSLSSCMEFRALKGSTSSRENFVYRYLCLHSKYHICSIFFSSLHGSAQKQLYSGRHLYKQL